MRAGQGACAPYAPGAQRGKDGTCAAQARSHLRQHVVGRHGRGQGHHVGQGGGQAGDLRHARARGARGGSNTGASEMPRAAGAGRAVRCLWCPLQVPYF